MPELVVVQAVAGSSPVAHPSSPLPARMAGHGTGPREGSTRIAGIAVATRVPP